MNQSPTIGAIAAALAKAQAAFKPAIKDANNPFFKKKYCDLAGALDAVRDALSNNGLALVQSTDAGEKMVLHTTLLHSSGEWISSTYPITAVKTDPQGIGSAVTYARRYSLMALLGIAAEDDDGEAAHGRAKEAAKVVTPKIPNPLSDAFKAATARGFSKTDLLAGASTACGYTIGGAADIKPEDIAKVITGWELMVAYEVKP